MIFAVLLLIIIPAILLRAWVITWMWLWFAVPFGLPAIGMAWAVGLSSFAALFTTKPASAKDEDAWDAMAKAAGVMFVSPLLALGTGWIAHLAMAA